MLNDKNDQIANARLVDEQIAEVAAEDLSITDLHLYPNPSKGQFTLDFVMEEAGEVSYQIIDIGGKLISKAKLPFVEGLQQWEINEQINLSTGIYTIQFTGPNWRSSKRLIIE